MSKQAYTIAQGSKVVQSGVVWSKMGEPKLSVRVYKDTISLWE